MSPLFRCAGVALLTSLTAACSGANAPDGASLDRGATASVLAEARPERPAAKTPSSKTLALGDDAAIAARRASLHRRSRVGEAAGPDRFIPSSAMYVVDPNAHAELGVALLRDGGVGDAVASVASSDVGVATARLEGGNVTVALTGKLGNAFVTTYDAQGNASAKFMVLAATARTGTLVVEDAALAPTVVVTKDDRVALDGQTSDAEAMGDVAESGGSFFVGDFSRMSLAIRDAIQKRADGGQELEAVYFPEQNLMFRLDGAARRGAGSLDMRGFAFTATLVTQGDFERYVDFGGTLTASPLHDPSAVESSTVDLGHGGFASEPTVDAVVLKDGRRVAGAAGLLAAEGDVASYELTYPRLRSDEEDEDIGPLHCHADAKVTLGMNALLSTDLQVEAGASWSNGSPKVDLVLHPHVRVGGEVRLGGAAHMTCDLRVKTIPMAEWGVPLLGTVKAQIPVVLRSELSANGSAGVVTPRFEIGSAADPTRPGKIGFRYDAASGFTGVNDIASRASGDHLELTDGTDERYAFSGGWRAGIAAGMELEAEVHAWIFKAKVQAEILDVFFGSDMTLEATWDGKGHYRGATEAGIGLFTTLEPTLSVNLRFFKASFRLFKVEIPTLWVHRSEPSSTNADVVEGAREVVVTDRGTPSRATLYSDAVVRSDMPDWGGDYVLVRGADEVRLTARRGELNLAGMPMKSGDQLFSVWKEMDRDHCQHTRAGQTICPTKEVRAPFYTKP